MSHLPSLYPDLERNFTPTESGSNVCSYAKRYPGGGPIVVLIHGYPQSAYSWRYIVPKLTPYVSVFIPELPSYGISTPPNAPLTKRLMGDAILSALRTVFSLTSAERIPVILVGHDRGARIAHRLAIDLAHPNRSTSSVLSYFDLQGLVLMDILPLTVQWTAMATNPSAAAGYFHWSFLARPDMAIPMIKAYGGDTFCRDLLPKGVGKNETGRASFFAGGSVEIYARNFATDDAIRGACEDYTDGATTEVQLEKEDEAAGRKIAVPTLVLWSEGGIGRWGDVGKIWKKDWVEEGVRVDGVGIGDGIGHWLAEEAPDAVSRAIIGFLESLGVKIE